MKLYKFNNRKTELRSKCNDLFIHCFKILNKNSQLPSVEECKDKHQIQLIYTLSFLYCLITAKKHSFHSLICTCEYKIYYTILIHHTGK